MAEDQLFCRVSERGNVMTDKRSNYAILNAAIESLTDTELEWRRQFLESAIQLTAKEKICGEQVSIPTLADDTLHDKAYADVIACLTEQKKRRDKNA